MCDKIITIVPAAEWGWAESSGGTSAQGAPEEPLTAVRHSPLASQRVSVQPSTSLQHLGPLAANYSELVLRPPALGSPHLVLPGTPPSHGA